MMLNEAELKQLKYKDDWITWYRNEHIRLAMDNIDLRLELMKLKEEKE